MDMLNILRNFDAAGKGQKSSAGAANKDSMKSILESFYSASATETKQTVNEAVSITSDSPDELAQLLKIMGGGAPAQAQSHSDQDMDMHMLRQIVSDPEPERESSCGSMEDADVEEDYINEPEEEYQDHKYMTKDLSGGINRQKKMYKPAAKGDNPMAVESIKDKLWAALNEKKMSKKKDVKATEGERHGNSKIYDKCWDGYKKVPGKKRGEPGSCVKK